MQLQLVNRRLVTCPTDRLGSTESVTMDSDKVLTALRAMDSVGSFDCFGFFLS